MYRGFNIKGLHEGIKVNHVDYYHKIGIQQYDGQKKQIEKTLKSFVSKEGFLDGSKMQDHWFPQVDADVFISHSHKNLKMAIVLAGWLHKVFKLKSFIDSCIWQYADNLLKIIDNEQCRNDHGNKYDYKKRNASTSHVHMMLSSALGMMMHKTECIFFLNTPEAVSSFDNLEMTSSPWIYMEIGMTQLIEKKSKNWHRRIKDRNFSGTEDLNESILHNLDLSHLTTINLDRLNDWRSKYERGGYSGNALDALYDLYPPKGKTTLHS
ncbi:hypothetical protein CLV59_105495 [Chitinophaga dinghuensis]|uniref:TIR domain-containing protein n=1 Tax=Chitinophaga dinghuensis TaxID=1539050 RepID=A0A327VZJ5_9BACT|nr:hypothetical protein [Chitinophaga dinghuensis]RAJ80386.1 hypothetical protein CLV59_105495 [Chitinophaga dinghuensis]